MDARQARIIEKLDVFGIETFRGSQYILDMREEANLALKSGYGFIRKTRLENLEGPHMYVYAGGFDKDIWKIPEIGDRITYRSFLSAPDSNEREGETSPVVAIQALRGDERTKAIERLDEVYQRISHLIK